MWGHGNALVARPPRLELAGVPLHVIQRGNNRVACFFGDVDRRFYLKCLGQAAARHKCAIHAYVLMTNHVHLLVTPDGRGSVGAMLQELGRRYVRVFNTVHERTGTLWEGRFKSSLVDSETYLLTCHRYIELNPVRAGLAAHPADYSWSSHAHHATGKPDGIITQHELYLALGRDSAERQAAFRALFATQIEPATLARIRETVNAGAALGSMAFLKALEATVGRTVEPRKRGRPAKPAENDVPAMPVSGKLL